MNIKAVLIGTLGFWMAGATAQELPMPPRFTLDSVPEEVLRSYPLGVVTELAARSHHGHPAHELTLPNGLQGWVYEVYGAEAGTTYVEPSGEERTVKEIRRGEPQFSFTLVFGAQGKVIDVLYDEPRAEPGPTALVYQRQMNPREQRLPGVEHGRHYAPGGGP